MIINVLDDCCELHYKFINKNYNFKLIFVYTCGIPTFICETQRSHIYYFESHELYQNSIQYILDNLCDQYVSKSFINDKNYNINELVFLHFLFDDNGSHFTNYDNMSQNEKQLFIQDTLKKTDIIIHDDVIRSLDFFTDKILNYAPCLEYQTCGSCYKSYDFYDLYIDTRWNFNRDNDNELIDPSICQNCYNKLDNEYQKYYQMPPENATLISNIICKYYFSN